MLLVVAMVAAIKIKGFALSELQGHLRKKTKIVVGAKSVPVWYYCRVSVSTPLPV